MKSASKKDSPIGPIKFAVLASDIVVFRIINGTLNVLLGKVVTPSKFTGMWALIGGLIRPEETADDAVERLLKSKAGISTIYTEQLYTFSAVDRDSRGRVVSVAYLALAGEDPQDILDTQVETTWCAYNDLPKLAYDHDEIVRYAYERIKGKITYTNIAQHLLPKEFTLSELQEIYEIILGEKLDKRNFRKKILACDILKDTKKTRKQGVMRPAALYSFTSAKQKIVQLM